MTSVKDVVEGDATYLESVDVDSLNRFSNSGKSANMSKASRLTRTSSASSVGEVLMSLSMKSIGSRELPLSQLVLDDSYGTFGTEQDDEAGRLADSVCCISSWDKSRVSADRCEVRFLAGFWAAALAELLVRVLEAAFSVVLASVARWLFLAGSSGAQTTATPEGIDASLAGLGLLLSMSTLLPPCSCDRLRMRGAEP